MNSILNSIVEHIVVIDKTGKLVYVNDSWVTFGENNSKSASEDWTCANYLTVCDNSAETEDIYGKQAAKGIRSVINKEKADFYLEYPCHSPDEKRWFMMRVTPLDFPDGDYFVISHQNITERILAENDARNLARIDDLTKIYNRRTFNEFFHEEWMRCARLKIPISLAMVDLDHFKMINDTYGHQAGDSCLARIGEILKEFTNRPGDICARYGGEEFVLMWGDTKIEQAKKLALNLQKKIASLNIRNDSSPTEHFLTASIGVAECVPASSIEESELLSRADTMLYKAKENGRNRVATELDIPTKRNSPQLAYRH